MSSFKEINGNQPLKRSKSVCSLSGDVNSERGSDDGRYQANHCRTVSNSSEEITGCARAASEPQAEGSRQLGDSGICDKTFDSELDVLEHKIDTLSDMFLEQCRLLTTMKEEIRSSRATAEKTESHQSDVINEIVENAVAQSTADGGTDNSRAKCLLAAIECNQGFVDSEIRDVLLDFLQSAELRERMVQVTADSVKDVIDSCLSRDVTALYLPILENSHRRLLRHVSRLVEDAFKELEEYSCCLSKSMYKISKSLHRAIDRHRNLLLAAADPQKNLVNTLKCTVEELLSNELKQWRQKVLDAFTSLQELEEPSKPASVDSPTSTSLPHPSDPERNIIDQLKVSEEIRRCMERGDVNSAFERALGAGDLALVTAACRGAARASVFEPCRLGQHVLLALLQQLSTDVLHDTQLKCSYLEDAIINLHPSNPVTHAHLPLVVGEVRKHLSKFLASYPGHVASRRVSLIIMAADNLLNNKTF